MAKKEEVMIDRPLCSKSGVFLIASLKFDGKPPRMFSIVCLK